MPKEERIACIVTKKKSIFWQVLLRGKLLHGSEAFSIAMIINTVIFLIVLGLFNAAIGEESMAERRKRNLAEADVILHIGPPKTATSHIQGALHRLRVELGHEGYCWPVTDGSTVHLHEIALAFIVGLPGPPAQVALVQNCLKSGQKMIFSTEKLSQVESKEGFAQIRKLFAGRRIHIIAAYRESLTVTYSNYNQGHRWKMQSPLPFSTFISVNYDRLYPQMHHSSLTAFAREFGQEHMTVIDFNGVMAVHKDMAYVLICELLGVVCGMQILPEERSNASEDLLPHYLFGVVSRLGNTLQCDVVLPDKDYRHVIARYEKEVDLEALPVNDVKFQGLAELARRVDTEIRSEFGDNMVYGNRTAAMSALDRFSLKEIDDAKFHASSRWSQWLWTEVRRLQTEGLFKNCAQMPAAAGKSKSKPKPAPGKKAAPGDDDGDEEEDDDE